MSHVWIDGSKRKTKQRFLSIEKNGVFLSNDAYAVAPVGRVATLVFAIDFVEAFFTGRGVGYNPEGVER